MQMNAQIDRQQTARCTTGRLPGRQIARDAQPDRQITACRQRSTRQTGRYADEHPGRSTSKYAGRLDNILDDRLDNRLDNRHISSRTDMQAIKKTSEQPDRQADI